MTHLSNVYDALVDEDWTAASDSLAAALTEGLPASINRTEVHRWIDDLYNESRFWSARDQRKATREMFKLLVEINAAQRQASGIRIDLKLTRKQQQDC